jgi:hypothetical protein
MNVYVTAQGVRTPKPKVAATPSSDVVINEQDVNTPPRYVIVDFYIFIPIHQLMSQRVVSFESDKCK